MRIGAGSAFTLTELLAVVGIMAIISVVAVPALRGLSGTGGRKQAMGQILGALELARNTAISIGTNAAVIFPDDNFALADYRLRSLAVVSWSATNTSAGAAADRMVGGWIRLPQGISLYGPMLTRLPKTNALLRAPVDPATFNNLPAVIFQADGGLLDDGITMIPTNGVGYGETMSLGSQSNLEVIRLLPVTGRASATLIPTAEANK